MANHCNSAGSPSGIRQHVALWLAGLFLGGVMIGPALGSGSLFNLDLVLTSQSPVPSGVWGLGPELPRRVPLWLVLSWVSPLSASATVGKVLMVLCIAAAFVGAYRIAASHGALAGVASGVLYATSPFLLTRLAVGHLMVAVPMALLPWVVRRLLHPGEDIARTFLAALALGLAGHFGGTLAVLVVVVGVVASRGHNWPKVVGAVVISQLPWVLPGLVVYSQGASIVDGTPFAVYAESLGDGMRVLAGHGFWQPLYQVGWPGGWSVLVVGVVLLGLAAVGARELAGPFGRRFTVLAGVGFTLAIASAVPGLSTVAVWISRTAAGSVLREGQRVLPLYLVWLAPAAAIGAQELGRRILRGAPQRGVSAVRGALGTAVQAVPLACAVLLAMPGVWGLDARLRPVEVPQEWAAARTAIAERPGPVLALPWHQYFDLQLDGIRRVLNPMPLYLGGDVITSSDPELQQSERRERVDPREPRIDRILEDARLERPISPALVELGVRWVVLQHEADWLDFGALGADRGLVKVVRGRTLDLFEVTGWRGPIVGDDGRTVPSNTVIEPFLQVDGSGPAVYQHPAASGWMRGWAPAGTTEWGTIALPAGSGPVWYWPSLLVLAGDLIAVAGMIWSLRRMRASPATGPGPPAARDADASE